MDVSVCIVTYNHERFIEQAIEGALMQRGALSMEIVITDDCSTDATPDIIARYAAAHGDKIRSIRREKNLGGTRNFAQAFAVCRGDYVAVVDGDDYWTSPDKLQRQFEFLQARPSCVACFHAATVVNEESPDTWVYRPVHVKEIYDLTDLLTEYEFATGSAMFRRSAIGELPEWYQALKIGDRTLFAMLAEEGSLGFMDEVMSVYRIHRGGAWSGQDRQGQWLDSLTADRALARYFKPRFASLFRARSAQLCFDLARGYEKRGELSTARKYAMRAIADGGLLRAKSRKTLLRMLVRFGCPPFYAGARRLPEDSWRA